MADSISSETPLYGKERIEATSTALTRNQEYIEQQNGLSISSYLLRLAQGIKQNDELINRMNTFQVFPLSETSDQLLLRLSEAAKKIALQHNPYEPLSFLDFQKKSKEFGLLPQDILALREYIIMDREAVRSRQRNLEAQQDAETDPLTGLLNLKGYERYTKQAIEHSRRANEPLSLVFVDADELKHINDTYGHQAGDELLQAIAQSLQLREADIVCRIGGDEFIIILAGTDIEATDNQGNSVATKIAQRLRENARQHPFSHGTPQFSIGFAKLTKGDTSESLKQRAEEQMKQDKQRRKQTNPSLRLRQ